jgi:Na+/melibiose symporter-like transporter
MGEAAPGAGARPTLWRIVIFSLAGLPVGAMAAGLLIYVPPYLATQLGVSLAVVSGVWATVRLIDIGIDPVLGLVMDRTRTRIGRYRPWMILGAPIFMLGVAMLYFAPPGIGMGYLVGWLLVLYLALSILSLAHPAWAATLDVTYGGRARVFGVMQVVAITALLATLAIPAVLGRGAKGDVHSVHVMGWFLIWLTPAAVAIAVIFTPERAKAAAPAKDRFGLGDVLLVLRKPDLLRLYAAQMAMTLGPGWMSSIYLFFSRDYMRFSTAQASILLLFYVMAGLVGAPTAAWLATRIGKHRTVMAAAVAYSVGLTTVLLVPKGALAAAIPVNLWCGFAGSAFELTIRSMLADVADEVKLDHGRDRLSLIYSLNSVGAKLASAGAIIVSYRILSALGYVPALGQANSPEAIRGLGLTFVSGPIACVMLGALFMIGWRMTADRHGRIRAALDARDAEAALGGADGEHIGDAAAAAERLGAA